MIVSARAKRPAKRRRAAALRLTLLVNAAALAGCGLSDGPGALFVDPGRYSAYHCKELIAESQALANRERELGNLMGKAGEGGGGSVIGAFAYRSDYESVLEQKKLVQRAAAEQKCEMVPSYNSDHVIR
jgi:hypothetical protein